MSRLHIYKVMDKEKLENELASAIMMVLKNHIVTGYDNEGMGQFIKCEIDFKYLHNQGGVLVRDLNYSSGFSNHVEQ
jgi:hypothetical protein